MIDRITFIESISGIIYPEMLMQFFDHFIALKKIVEDSGEIIVLSSNENSIIFEIKFKNTKSKDKALTIVQSGPIMIYGRPINVTIHDTLNSTDLKFILQ